MLMGIFSFINFGFYFAMSASTAEWLQMPERDHGYEFTAQQNAACKLFVLHRLPKLHQLIRLSCSQSRLSAGEAF